MFDLHFGDLAGRLNPSPTVDEIAKHPMCLLDRFIAKEFYHRTGFFLQEPSIAEPVMPAFGRIHSNYQDFIRLPCEMKVGWPLWIKLRIVNEALAKGLAEYDVKLLLRRWWWPHSL